MNNLLMKRILLIVILLVITTILYSQQKYDIDFIQTKVVKISGKTTEKAGHLIFDGNERLSMAYTNPEGEFFNIEGNMVKMNLDGKKAELNAEKVKMVRLQRATLLNCLSGNWEQAAIDNNADTSIEEENGFRTITLTAKGKVPKGGYASVVLKYGTDGVLVKMVLEEAVGAINTYEMSR